MMSPNLIEKWWMYNCKISYLKSKLKLKLFMNFRNQIEIIYEIYTSNHNYEWNNVLDKLGFLMPPTWCTK